jgi:hypothetical protein
LTGATLGSARGGSAVAGAEAIALGGSAGAGVATAGGADGGARGTAAGRAAGALGCAVATGCAVDGVTADADVDAGRFAGDVSEVECVAESST